MRPIHIFLLLSAAALLAGLYKTFEKAGEKGWKALVPVYNFVIWLKLIKKPWWWIFLVLIPTVGFYMLAVMIVLLSNCFGKRKFSQHVLAVIGYFIWMPYLGFSKEVKWQGVPAEGTSPAEKKGGSVKMAREWGEAAVFAIVAATLIRTFFFEAFVIPSSSMEGTLLVGDYLFVSKLSYGAKIPSVPLTIPFTHNTIPGTETTPSYLDWIELPSMRLPALGDVQRNDIVVFNFPEGDTVWKQDRNSSYYQQVRDYALMQTQGNTEAIRTKFIEENQIVIHPVDKEDNYVKRCVGLPGDLIQIKNKQLFVNGQPAFVPANVQYSYDISGNFSKDQLAEMGIEETILRHNGYRTGIVATKDEIDMLRPQLAGIQENIDVFDSLEIAAQRTLAGGGDDLDHFLFLEKYNIFPHSPSVFKWTRDNFGPMLIPKKGATVHLSVDSLPLWHRIISVYEGNDLAVKNGQILINGQPATTYTFKQDYYWMMGDNRHNSLDSRYWGYVPADHIVGKPVFVWFSKGDVAGLRTNRMMTFVTRDGLSRSYLWWVLGGIVLIVGYGQIKNRKKDGDDKGKKLSVNTNKK